MNAALHFLPQFKVPFLQSYEPRLVVQYRKSLLTSVKKQGAKNRKEINWEKLSKKFYPRSKATLQENFNDLTLRSWTLRSCWGKVESSDDFLRRLDLGLKKCEELDDLSNKNLLKQFKGLYKKQALYEHYQHLIGST